jgi:hypothetical protein
VLIELGWALSQLGPDRIVAVLNPAHGYQAEDLPFHIRHRRALTYRLAADADMATRKTAKGELTGDLTGALRTNLRQYVDEQAAALEIEGVPAKPDDPSIWATASDRLEHHDMLGRMTSHALPSCPRGYIRIIPAGWKSGVPAVRVIADMRHEEAVQPLVEGLRSGDFGACEEGYVRYWLTGMASDDEFETRNVAMWFDQTGEFWVIHGTAIDEWKQGRHALRAEALIRGWHHGLRQAMAIYNRLGADHARKVEAGLVGVRGVLWPSRFRSDSIPARKGQCALTRQLHNWNEDAQRQFLTDAYNKVRDLFGLPHVDQEGIRDLLQ